VNERDPTFGKLSRGIFWVGFALRFLAYASPDVLHHLPTLNHSKVVSVAHGHWVAGSHRPLSLKITQRKNRLSLYSK